jgi:hypothetical protein
MRTARYLDAIYELLVFDWALERKDPDQERIDCSGKDPLRLFAS